MTTNTSSSSPEWLTVRGARDHNLAGVSVRFPHRSLVVFTGPSGSGKSTLAFDTIYAECQRRHIQSMSAFARQFLGEADKPDVEAIDGLCPALALDQRTASRNPRSTVGTATEIYDLLRILFARLGVPHCVTCDEPLPCASGHDGRKPELTPRAFSFNLPHGACPACQGLGSEPEADVGLVVPDPDLALTEGALAPWRTPSTKSELAVAIEVAERLGGDSRMAWRELPEPVREALLNGGAAEEAPTGRRTRGQVFHGVIPWLHRQYRDGFSETARTRAASYMRLVPCRECGGARLNAAQRAVRLAGRRPGEICALTVLDCLTFFRAVAPDAVSAQALEEIVGRLECLIEVGLDHLALDRPAPTLSGGESQRLRLAQQLGTRLFGLLYVLDEPTSGLHPADVDGLLASLRRLRDQGNSVLVVEHDLAVVRAADWVVDLGPGAGSEGGRVMYSGPSGDVDPESLLGAYLTGRRSAGLVRERRVPDDARRLVVRGARAHNLAGADVPFPLGCFVAVVGVSGSGKSTLVDQVLYRAVARQVEGAPVVPGEHDRVEGAEWVDRVVRVDQAPIGRSPRSNPATYTGAFEPIRNLFARTDQAKELGFTPGQFSFNTVGGRCEVCSGDGVLRIDMRFLPDIFVPCDTCHGTRYNASTLGVRYRDLTIADVLNLSVRDALAVFADTQAIRCPLQALADVGLGYLSLGQPATTLSGGEAQRVKLAAELARKNNGHTLYVLDEPTTGLHPEDIRGLLAVLHGLTGQGHTVVVVEHDVSVVASADWVVELGPGSGKRGGQVIAIGTPEDVAAAPGSVTGPYLRGAL